MGRFLYRFVHVRVYLVPVPTDNVSLAVESEKKK